MPRIRLIMSDEALAGYFREAASWDLDRSAQAIRRARLAWLVAGGGWACAIASALALALAMPLKTVEPYVIRVDRTTGIVDIVPMYEGHEDPGEAVARYLLSHYVTLCEGFNYSTAERDYQECGSYHTQKRNQEWYNLWNPASPASPLNLYKDGTQIRAQVTAITFFKRANGLSELAQVRYIKARRPPGGTETITHWIATIEYAYVAPSKDVKLRQWNPLGFKVTDFHTEAENVVESTTLPAPTP
jgi:type IV secretion system protein VirB8